MRAALLPAGAFVTFLVLFVLPILAPLVAELHKLTLAQSASVLRALEVLA